MHKVVIAGGTGMVGSLVLEQCLEDPDVKEVISLVRKPTGRSDSKLQEIVVADLLDYSQLNIDLTNIDAVFFCIGVYTGAVDQDTFRTITTDIPVALAKETYLDDFVIDKAKTRLLATEETVSEVAYELGFSYPQHFAKIFKAKTGMSPTQYRISA